MVPVLSIQIYPQGPGNDGRLHDEVVSKDEQELAVGGVVKETRLLASSDFLFLLTRLPLLPSPAGKPVKTN